MTIRAEHLRVRGMHLRLDLARFLPPFILGAYGIFLLSLLARGIMTWYINPSYVWPTTAAGIVLVALAAVRLIRRPAVHCGCDDCAAGTCDCEEAPVRIWPYMVMCVPLLIALVVPPRSLAAFSARQRGLQIAGVSAVSGAATVKRVSLSVDTRSFTLQDWVGALSADPNPKDYTGKPVLLTGMVLHNSASMPPGYIMVMRYQVTCCIADARAEGLIVKDSSRGALQDNQWVRVNGSMGSASYDGQQIAVVIPKSLTPVKAGNPYMY